MVELWVEPRVNGVATLTCSWKACREVIEDGGPKIFLMAGVARGRKARELTRGRVLMAVDALQESMGADQRETILVIAQLLQRDLPAPYGVAAFTVGAELTAMNIRVAIRAMSTYVFEDQVRVALSTGHLLVHSAQRIAGMVMIEFRIRTNRFPTSVGVAFLAWDGDGPVGIRHLGLGTAHTGPRTVSGLLRSSSGEQGDKSNNNRSKPARTYHLSLRVFQGPAPVTTGVETDR